MATKRFLLGVLAYFVITLAVAYPWHMVWFKELYAEFGMYSRAEPIIPLGMLAITIQGIVFSWAYPRLQGGGPPVLEGIRVTLILGLLIYTVMTFANLAKIEVTSVGGFIAMHTAFQLIQFVLFGAVLGLIHGKGPV